MRRPLVPPAAAEAGAARTRLSRMEALMESEDAEWLRQLEAPRGRDGALMCVARWHPDEQLALVEREKGSDLHVFGVYKQGQLWLSAEETLCLVEDGLLELMLGEAPPLPLEL